MERYNHSLVERKWMPKISDSPVDGAPLPRVGSLLVPGEGPECDLENARLLVLADFLALTSWGPGFAHVYWGERQVEPLLRRLGVRAFFSERQEGGELVVLPRDFPQLWPSGTHGRVFICGRLLGGMALKPLLFDFGGDALRLYFLYQGPPERDYRFNWYGVASAHRFVQKVWQLANSVKNELLTPMRQEELGTLVQVVQARLAQGKPHTALAAVMAYLKDKTALVPEEIRAVSRLLRPFAPFLSTELTDLVAPLLDDKDGQKD